jgi:hypothetical protein
MAQAVGLRPLTAEALIYILPLRRRASNRYNYQNASVFDSRQGQETFLFSKTSRSTLAPTQSPIHFVSEAIFLETKQSYCEADKYLQQE